jgi:hypothetical protein
MRRRIKILIEALLTFKIPLPTEELSTELSESAMTRRTESRPQMLRMVRMEHNRRNRREDTLS